MKIGKKEIITITFIPEESGVKVNKEMKLSDDMTSLAMVVELVEMAKYLLQIIPLQAGRDDEKLIKLKEIKNNRTNEVFDVVAKILNREDTNILGGLFSNVCYGASSLTCTMEKYCDMLGIVLEDHKDNVRRP